MTGCNKEFFCYGALGHKIFRVSKHSQEISLLRTRAQLNKDNKEPGFLVKCPCYGLNKELTRNGVNKEFLVSLNKGLLVKHGNKEKTLVKQVHCQFLVQRCLRTLTRQVLVRACTHVFYEDCPC